MIAPLIFAVVVATAQVASGHPGGLEIVGGDEAKPHQFPWQVAIQMYLEEGVAFCGGSLIDKRWVLTAGHCASPGQPVKKYEVILGAHEIGNKDEAGRVVLPVAVSDVFVGPDWKGIMSGSLRGDIALFRLPQDAPLSDAIQIVRLPSEAQKDNSFWRETVTISGWGTQHTRDKTVAPKLRFTSGKVVSNFYCKFRFLFLLASDTNICMSGWGWKGACHGDSGGPMVFYEKDGKPTLVGVTSFGLGFACEWGFPSAYTRVTKYTDWIQKTIKEN